LKDIAVEDVDPFTISEHKFGGLPELVDRVRPAHRKSGDDARELKRERAASQGTRYDVEATRLLARPVGHAQVQANIR
jgi:hypothetical protein